MYRRETPEQCALPDDLRKNDKFRSCQSLFLKHLQRICVDNGGVVLLVIVIVEIRLRQKIIRSLPVCWGFN